MSKAPHPIGLRDPRGWLALLLGMLLAAVVVLGVRVLDEVVYEDAPGYQTSLWTLDEEPVEEPVEEP